MATEATEGPGRTRLSLWDTTSIVVGIIVGVGIYRTAGTVFDYTGSVWLAVAVWISGGALSFLGALCFAELSSTYARSGGEYVYLTRAYGSWMGFLFAWAQLTVIRSAGSIVSVAILFAEFFGKLFTAEKWDNVRIASAAMLPVLLLTAINIIGVNPGKQTQNILTVLKLLTLSAIIVVGLLLHHTPPTQQYERGLVEAQQHEQLTLRRADGTQRTFHVTTTTAIVIDDSKKDAEGKQYTLADLQPELAVKVAFAAAQPGQAVHISATRSSWKLLMLGMIYVLWTYAGWHEAAYVVSEVRNEQRTVPLALLLGTALVIVLYLLVVFAALFALGLEQAAASDTVAASILEAAFGSWAGVLMCVLVICSALGALNGMIFTSARIYAEMGRDHPLFASLGRWHPRLGTPAIALLVQCAICLGFLLVVGWLYEEKSSFEIMLEYTSAVFWFCFFLTGVAVLVLRWREPDVPRPFRVPGYPWPVLLFCTCTLALVVSFVWSAPLNSLIGAGLVLTGVPLYFLSEALRKRPPLT